MIKGLAHVCLGSDDLDASLKFYCECLGLRRHFDFVKDGSLVGFYLEIGKGSYVEIFKGEKLSPQGSLPIRHFCLEVDDIDAILERLRSFGFKAGDKKMGADHSWQAWTSDPSGVAIEFHQYTSESCQATKAACVL